MAINNPAAERRTPIKSNFDINALKKKLLRQRTAKHNDLVARVRELDNRIENMKVGQCLEIPIPEGKTPQAAVAAFRAPVTNLCFAGREWAGRSFEILSSAEDNLIYIYRDEDLLEPKQRKERSDTSADDSNEEEEENGESENGVTVTKA